MEETLGLRDLDVLPLSTSVLRVERVHTGSPLPFVPVRLRMTVLGTLDGKTLCSDILPITKSNMSSYCEI